MYGHLVNAPQIVQSTELHLKCMHERTQFVDDKFPANLFSLIGAVKPQEYRNEWDVFKWKRPDKIWLAGSYQFIQAIHPSNIKQGFLNDGYFLSAVAILADHPSLISRLFTTSTVNPTGVYGVWLHINGSWTEIVVDDQLPVFVNDKGITEFAFSHTVSNEYWLQILEKAYAKAYGSYYTISGGTLALALNDLTGAPCETIRLNQGESPAELWKNLESLDRRGSIIALNIRPNHTMSQASTGLHSGMGYKITMLKEVPSGDGSLLKLIKIRSDWGKVNIDKLWPDSKVKWNQRTKDTLGEISSNDGSFWLPLDLALNFFDELVVCRLMPDYRFANTVMPSRKYNAAALWVSEGILADISVIQEDLRSRRKTGTTNLKYHFCRMTILEITATGFRFVRSLFGNQRNLSVNEPLSAGQYVILVEFYLPLYFQSSNFSIELHSASSRVMLSPCELETPDLFIRTELEAWKSYADLHASTWTPQKSDIQYQVYMQKHEDAYVQLEAIANIANPPVNVVYERSYLGEGIEVTANKQGEVYLLQPQPGHCDVAVIKHNPLNPEVDFTMTGFMPVITPFSAAPHKTQETHAKWRDIYVRLKQRELDDERINEGGCGSKCSLI